MILSLLFFLATIDGGLAGYRAYAGREPKHPGGAVVRGMVAAQVGLAIIAATSWMALRLSADPERAYAAFLAAGVRMAWVFGPYTLAVLGALAASAILRRDLGRALVSGPLARVRPYVILAGALIPLWFEVRPETAAVCAVTAAAVSAIEPLLRRLRPPD